MSSEEIKKQALNLTKQKKYSEALNLYENLWQNNRNDFNEWDYFNYSACLKQAAKNKEALTVCREGLKIYPDFELLKKNCAWLIYKVELSNSSDEAKILQAAEEITRIVKQEDKSQSKAGDYPCVYALAVFKALDFFKNNKNNFPADTILYLTSKLNPLYLDSNPLSFKDKDGKTRELASKKEDWYSLRAKALYETGMYQDCIKLCDEALKTISKFHYDNDIWFKRFRALSLAALGNKDGAVNELKNLLQKRKEWFIQKEIAEILYEQNKFEDALKFAIDGALNFGDADKKIHLFKLIADILQKLNKNDEAKEHIKLIYIIKKTNGWKIDAELTKAAISYQIDTNNLPNLTDHLKSLKSYWEKTKFGNQALQKGIISKILPNGDAGFIKCDSGQSYYFATKEFKGKKELLKEGARVQFFLEDSFDKKKNQPTKVAVSVKILSS